MDFIELTTELQQIITPDQAWYYSIIPQNNDDAISFYIDRKKVNGSTADELEILFGKPVNLEKTDSQLINKTLGKYYRKREERKIKRKVQNVLFDNNQHEDILYKLIDEANSVNSSDIHIESYKDKCRVRLRIDGKLIERNTFSKSEYPALVNKVKIKANLDIAEKRLPQDGRILFESDNGEFDIRVSTLPSLFGEKIVLRLLSRDSTEINIRQLGFEEKQLSDYLEGLKKTHGIILISGPTGSGKTTTLYATLKILNNEDTNILTIEDPIEYTLDGINQVQLKESIGLTFASALRTFLRQDPDIIMLGEIRDPETAQMAIRAALTGHLVLSTIHTNSAWGTVSRLIDMGIPSFLLADTLNLSIAQRLVRLLCPKCKKKQAFERYNMSSVIKDKYKSKWHYTAQGCEYCYYTGYKGRRAIFEVIPINTDIAQNIKNEVYNINEYLKTKSIKTMQEIAIDLVCDGETSFNEIYPILLNN